MRRCCFQTFYSWVARGRRAMPLGAAAPPCLAASPADGVWGTGWQLLLEVALPAGLACGSANVHLLQQLLQQRASQLPKAAAKPPQRMRCHRHTRDAPFNPPRIPLAPLAGCAPPALRL